MTDEQPPPYPCVEKGIWTPILRPPPPGNSLRLKLKKIDAKVSRAAKKRGVMTFHAVGCSGCYEDPWPGLRVSQAMAAQAGKPRVFGGEAGARTPSFLYHLGDIAYKDDAPAGPEGEPPAGKDVAGLYATQFFAQFDRYKPDIFAVPGNHDLKGHKDGSAISHFLDNFCDKKRRRPKGKSNWRKTMCQPYPYWLLETPVAYIVGLAANDLNGGQLDDPMSSRRPQYLWLVETLAAIKAENEARAGKKSNPKAFLLAIHYPPFSGSANFVQRGDPNLGPTPRAKSLLPLGTILHQAFHRTGQFPDAVLSAHAHLYQRITYTVGGSRQIPYLVSGSGGHAPIEKLDHDCWGKTVPPAPVPFDVVLPPCLSLPPEDKAQVVCFNDEDFGFLRLTIDLPARSLVGEFFAVPSRSAGRGKVLAKRRDHFTLDLDRHRLG